MLQKNLTVFLCGLLVISMILAGCGSTEAEESTETAEEGEAAHLDIKTSIAGWIPANTDNISETIGALVTSDTPIARDIAAKAIKTALLTELDVSVKHIQYIEGEDKYSARVALGFPLLMKLPVIGEKEYWVEVSYEFTLENGQVVDTELDISSFEMKETGS
jgi:outer membrane lipoprotein-sorting protein